ncbi:MAG: hypothetical protein CM15mP128_4950 [Methanobacteriota archaeon]|nr:MAG: hypothetical protein CM15mP128_4950 [Euryarchaeota archaeon]
MKCSTLRAKRFRPSKASVPEASYDAASVVLHREEDGSRLTWTGQHLPLVDSDLMLPGMREGMLSPARDKAEVLLVDWTLEVRRCLERVVEHQSTPA